jgi:fucose permease
MIIGEDIGRVIHYKKTDWICLQGAIIQCFGHVIQSIAPPFPVLCMGYFLCGTGLAMLDAQANGYVAQLQEQAATKMGLLHASYGIIVSFDGE